MKTKAILILPLLALAACATPRESCISQAQVDLRRVNGFIAEAQANIARGYAVETRQETRVRRDTCERTRTDAQGNTTVDRYPCDRTDIVDRQVPVAIDLNAERAKLASLLQQRTTLEQRTQAQVSACVAAHPE